MKKLNYLLLASFLMLSSFMYGQSTITGKVVDETNNTLANATVKLKGSNNSVTTTEDGSFTITSKEKEGSIVVSFIGFETKEISFNDTQNVGTIFLTSTSNAIEEVVVVGKGVVDLVKDRKTPVAVSTIKAAEIQAKIGSTDITQALVNTPSVYVAGQAGGFGDSRITVRGFQQDNTAFLLNGQPINGMEDGKMYWSNWSGMADIANAIQIQRGLGSSKLAISSVGGTVNFVTKATAKKDIPSDIFEKRPTLYVIDPSLLGRRKADRKLLAEYIDKLDLTELDKDRLHRDAMTKEKTDFFVDVDESEIEYLKDENQTED